MRSRAFAALAGAGMLVLLSGCGTARTSPCRDPLAVIQAFYDANDASRFEASLSLLTPDATVTTWAEGVHGRHWQERRLTGREQILGVLATRGFRRASGQPGAPIFHEAEARVTGERVSFMLRPDRLSPGQRPYNPYGVEAVFSGCRIKSLTVIEYISWE
jgi:hypothetical protein